MNHPKVTIMIPTYNRAKLLKETIESCLMQDYPNLEIVVSDNASTDNTPDIIKEYLKDERVKYFRQEINISGEQWEKLLYEYATGDYGMLLCDDDYITDKSYISQSVSLILRNNLVFVLSMFGVKNEMDGTFHYYNMNLPRITSPEWWVDNCGKRQNNIYIGPTLVPGGVFNLKAARRVNGFCNAKYGYGLDIELGMKLVLSGNTGFINKPCCVLRLHGNNTGITTDFDETLKGMIKLIKGVHEYGVSIGLSKSKSKKFKHRILIPFIRASLLAKLFSIRNGFLSSLFFFYKTIFELDWTLFLYYALSPVFLIKALCSRNQNLYGFARRIYRKSRLLLKPCE
jgi:glycosyltransferase involved in cell wall biosynthesis